MKKFNHQLFLNNFFFLNFLFSFTSFNSFHNYHHHFNFFFTQEYKNDLVVVDTRRFFNRWRDSQTLIFNIYYFNFSPLLFGAVNFKNEILAIN